LSNANSALAQPTFSISASPLRGSNPKILLKAHRHAFSSKLSMSFLVFLNTKKNEKNGRGPMPEPFFLFLKETFSLF
jgi:hypothetical protein